MSNAAFEELVNRHSRQVLNVALRVLGNAESAGDVHQEVFLAIWRRWHKFNGQVNWNAYLYRVTVRKAIDSARRSRARASAELAPAEVAEENDPDAPLRADELRQELTSCLAKLPERQAEVFVLSRIEGLNHQAIARLLDCSEQTVRVHLHRATKRLARELSGYLK